MHGTDNFFLDKYSCTYIMYIVYRCKTHHSSFHLKIQPIMIYRYPFEEILLGDQIT